MRRRQMIDPAGPARPLAAGPPLGPRGPTEPVLPSGTDRKPRTGPGRLTVSRRPT